MCFIQLIVELCISNVWFNWSVDQMNWDMAAASGVIGRFHMCGENEQLQQSNSDRHNLHSVCMCNDTMHVCCWTCCCHDKVSASWFICQEIGCHLVFDTKMTFERKVCFVTSGHAANTLASIACSSFVSRWKCKISFSHCWIEQCWCHILWLGKCLPWCAVSREDLVWRQSRMRRWSWQNFDSCWSTVWAQNHECFMEGNIGRSFGGPGIQICEGRSGHVDQTGSSRWWFWALWDDFCVHWWHPCCFSHSQIHCWWDHLSLQSEEGQQWEAGTSLGSKHWQISVAQWWRGVEFVTWRLCQECNWDSWETVCQGWWRLHPQEQCQESFSSELWARIRCHWWDRTRNCIKISAVDWCLLMGS